MSDLVECINCSSIISASDDSCPECGIEFEKDEEPPMGTQPITPEQIVREWLEKEYGPDYTDEQWLASKQWHDDKIELAQTAFTAGAASRDARVKELEEENAELKAVIEGLSDVADGKIIKVRTGHIKEQVAEFFSKFRKRTPQTTDNTQSK